MKALVRIGACLLLAIPITLLLVVLYRPTLNPPNFYRVKRVLDSETLVLDSGHQVRLLGVDTSMSKRNQIAQEAKTFVRRMTEGKRITLEFHFVHEEQNRSGILDAFVFLPDKTLLNGEIIRHGYGTAVLTRPPLKYEQQFTAFEIEARQNYRGIWKE